MIFTKNNDSIGISSLFNLTCLIVAIIALSLFSPALLWGHSGGIDSNGGHNDTANGGYHYHHGNPPHQHPNGECPYESSSSYTLWLIYVIIIFVILTSLVIFLVRFIRRRKNKQ